MLQIGKIQDIKNVILLKHIPSFSLSLYSTHWYCVYTNKLNTIHTAFYILIKINKQGFKVTPFISATHVSKTRAAFFSKC